MLIYAVTRKSFFLAVGRRSCCICVYVAFTQ